MNKHTENGKFNLFPSNWLILLLPSKARIGLVTVALFTLMLSDAVAQPVPSFFQPAEFTTKKGKAIVLIFVAMEDRSGKFINRGGDTIVAPISSFSAASTRWIRDADRKQKQLYSRIQKLKEDAARLHSNAAPRRKAFLSNLAKNQDIGWVLEKELVEYFANAKSAEEKFRALCGFAFVARDCDRNYAFVKHSIEGNEEELTPLIISHPDRLLPSIGRFGERASPYLKHVASTGNPVVGDGVNFEFVDKPRVIKSVDEAPNLARAAALLGLGVPHLNSLKIANFLGEAFDVAMNVKVNGRIDVASARAAVIAIGENGKNGTLHSQRMTRASKLFLRETKEVRRKLEIMRNRDSTLDHFKTNRLFSDSDGNEIVFGRVVRESETEYVFLDFMNQVVHKEKQSFDQTGRRLIEAVLKDFRASQNNAAKD